MTIGRVAWVVGGYLAGTIPSTYLIARWRGALDLEAASDRRVGEADPHILMPLYLGWKWAALASTADVLKGMLVVLAARDWGALSPPWLAAVGVAAVLGHAFPFYRRRMAGRGLATAAGVLLVLLPVEMAIAGAAIVLGAILNETGLASTLGMASIPFVAWGRGQPFAYVAMAAVIFVVLVIRRLEGVSDVVRSGVPWPRAVLRRAVFDAST